MFDRSVASLWNITSQLQMLSPVLDVQCSKIYWPAVLNGYALWLNVLVPCGGKRYVQGSMLSDLLVFSQWEAKIRSDTHFPHIGSRSPNNNRCIHLSDCISWVVCCDPEDWQLGCIRNVFMVSAASVFVMRSDAHLWWSLPKLVWSLPKASHMWKGILHIRPSDVCGL